MNDSSYGFGFDADADVDENQQRRRTVEYSRLKEKFQNAGYRDGQEKGYADVLQASFNSGWLVGVERGRKLGYWRAVASVVKEESLDASDSTDTSTAYSRLAKLRATEWNEDEYMQCRIVLMDAARARNLNLQCES